MKNYVWSNNVDVFKHNKGPTLHETKPT